MQTLALLGGGFCWRSAYNANCAFIANVQAVRVHDTIALFYTQQDKADLYLGTYEVMKPSLVATEKTPALHKVTETTLEEQLFSAEYKLDPCLDAYVGFQVNKDLFATEPPSPNWPGPNALVRLRSLRSP